MFSAGEIFIKSFSQNFKNIKCPHINEKHSRDNGGPIPQTIRALKIKNHIFGFENPIIGRNSRKINTENSVGPYKTVRQKLLFIEYTWYRSKFPRQFQPRVVFRCGASASRTRARSLYFSFKTRKNWTSRVGSYNWPLNVSFWCPAPIESKTRKF